MADAAKAQSTGFTDAARQLSPGDIMEIAGPIPHPPFGEFAYRCVSINENGLVTLEITWLGVFFGFVQGKPNTSFPGWRFTQKP